MAKELQMYKITFHGEGGDVELVHNFKVNVYQRNVECLIDENYLGVVKSAVVETEIPTDIDGDKKYKKVRIPQLQYTYEPV